MVSTPMPTSVITTAPAIADWLSMYQAMIQTDINEENRPTITIK